jgi:hypothetical protein
VHRPDQATNPSLDGQTGRQPGPAVRQDAMSKPVIDWFKDDPLADNFEKVGRALASHLPGVVHDENGLILLENGRTRRIDSAGKLSPFLIDNLNLKVWSEPDRNGDRKRVERLSEATLRDLLGSRTFLRNFPKVQDIATTPVVLADGTPSKPGHNPGGILYTGPVVKIGSGLDTIKRFLDVIGFDCNASRTNAVAAALTVLWRHHWCGAKPLILVTANKSHSGKGTMCKFIAGNCPHVDMSYQSTQWAMETTLQSQLSEYRRQASSSSTMSVSLAMTGLSRASCLNRSSRTATSSLPFPAETPPSEVPTSTS